MNDEFAKRQAQVLELLGVLSKNAEKQKETLVFIGGSAVQTILKKPQRLSIDLDIYYSGKPDALMAMIPEDYKVQKRKAFNEQLFLFYDAVKNDARVKIDISRFDLVKKGKPFKPRKIRAGKITFRCNVATHDYLLAAKFSSLAIHTVGRKPGKTDFQQNLLKDIFDSNCLLDEFGNEGKTRDYFSQIVEIQNDLRGTDFSPEQAIDSAIKALLDSTQETKQHSLVSKGTLQNFSQYLLSGNISKPKYWEMAYRLSCHLNCFRLTENALKIISSIEASVNKNFGDHDYANKCEAKLVEKGISKEHAHELKVLAPKALLYLCQTLKT